MRRRLVDVYKHTEGGGDRCVRIPYEEEEEEAEEEEEEDNVPSFKGAVFSRKRMTKMEAASGGTASSAPSTASFSRAIAAPACQEGRPKQALQPRSEHDSL
jgi:hypothetical protein